MVVKIYGPTTSVSVQRVMLCLLEKDVEFELQHIDLDTMEHKSPHYVLKQPFGKVPYVEDGNLKLFESRAIVRYYAAKHSSSGPNLLGKTIEDRAKVDQWIDVEALTYDPLVFPIVFNLVILPSLGKPSQPSLAHACVDKLQKVLDIYDHNLSANRFLCGDDFTLADLVHIPATWRLFKDANYECLISGRRHVRTWWDALSTRSSWKKVMEMEKSSLSM